MTTRRDRRRALLQDVSPAAADTTKLIQFGSPRRAADRCTFYDAPAEFALCLDCSFKRGARGSGILCAHRYGLDPTLVDGVLTQLDGDSIRWIATEERPDTEDP